MEGPHRFSTLLAEQNARIGREGRKGSVLAEQYKEGVRAPPRGEHPPEIPPTNEEVAKAVQQKVAAAVELSRNYFHVLWYTIFVGAYMAVLYLQASAYNSGEVVQTLQNVFMPGGGSLTFQTEQEVLEYIGQQVIVPIWQDPVCGDMVCEYPWEFPAWGNFGCQADCGLNPNVTSLAINVRADFTGHPTISAQVLMNNAAWNLCLDDASRRSRGEPDLCWYSSSQTFTEEQSNQILSMSVIDGNWYILVSGDYAGRVSGSIYDVNNSSNPILVPTSPAWTACKINRQRTASTATTALRRLLQAYTQAHRMGGEDGRRVLVEAMDEIQAMPGLQHLDFEKIKNGGLEPEQSAPA